MWECRLSLRESTRPSRSERRHSFSHRSLRHTAFRGERGLLTRNGRRVVVSIGEVSHVRDLRVARISPDAFDLDAVAAGTQLLADLEAVGRAEPLPHRLAVHL